MNSKSGRKRKKVLTTIALSLPTKAELKERLQGPGDSYEGLVKRLVNGITDVYVEFLAIDNELPQTHTVIMQLGNDVNSLYYWDGEKNIPITIQSAQQLIKKPSRYVCVDLEDFKAWLEANASGTNLSEVDKVVSIQNLEDYLKNKRATIECPT